MLRAGLLFVYSCLLNILFIFLGHRLWMLWQCRRRGVVDDPPPTVDWPRVTIQLPVFNERDVVGRLLQAIERLDYPADRLYIQILDDSTDDTVQLVQAGARRLRELGIRADVLRREQRVGFKAGALAEGLRHTQDPYIAIFDADFMPTPDFLRRTIPWLEQGYGMVQTRWSHLNLDQSWLTRAEGILLDGHFVVEHAARHYSGCWFNFNGTAGIWRREAILTAGGWAADTLTEDLDISYRAQLAGWRFKYLPDVVQPGELPATVAAFKTQQQRWAKGSIQTARKLLPTIWRSAAPLRTKIEASFHLLANFGYPALLAVMALAPWMAGLRQDAPAAAPSLLDLPIFSAAFLSLILFYLVAMRASSTQPPRQRLAHIPLALVLAVGMAISQTRAVYEGLLKNAGVFQRTPKQGAARRSSYGSTAGALPWGECLMGVYLLGAWVWLAVQGQYSTLWFVALCAVGFLAVGWRQIAESRASG